MASCANTGCQLANQWTVIIIMHCIRTISVEQLVVFRFCVAVMKLFKAYLPAIIVPVALYALVTHYWVPSETGSSSSRQQLKAPMGAKEVRNIIHIYDQPDSHHLSGHPASPNSSQQHVKPPPTPPKDYRNNQSLHSNVKPPPTPPKDYRNNQSLHSNVKPPPTPPKDYRKIQSLHSNHGNPSKNLTTVQPSKDNSSGAVAFDPVLPPDVINQVKKFLFFLSNGRCGSSIIGALLDAHPHVVVAHEAHFIKEVPKYIGSKEKLFNELYAKSATKTREKAIVQGWSLKINNSWQGSYDKFIDVIGDKDGAALASLYSKDKEKFRKYYLVLLNTTLKMPIRVIHAIRNPFDTIATRALVRSKSASNYAMIKAKNATRKISARVLQTYIDNEFRLYNRAEELIGLHGRDNILDVHNCDLVADPKAAFSKIFDFLGVQTTEEYLDTCAGTIFKSVSKSRSRLEWTPQQIEMVEERMKNHDMLSRYSFTSE